VDDENLGQASILLLLEGTDAYDGWSFVAHLLDAFTGEPDDLYVTHVGASPLAPTIRTRCQPAPRRPAIPC
jgi:hypothetical protein